MAGVAESAVLVSSAGAAEVVTKLKPVQGPSSDFHNAQHVLDCYPAMGFQATNFGEACHLAEVMLRRQAPSKVYQMKDGKYVLVRPDDAEVHADTEEAEGGEKEAAAKSTKARSRSGFVRPALFLGVTANLFGTGCREAIRFLVQEGVEPNPDAAARNSGEEVAVPEDASEDQLMFARLRKEYRETHNGARALADEAVPAFRSFLCSIVVSGGGVEHDVRRACAAYTVTRYASEPSAKANSRAAKQTATAAPAAAHFGNISYPSQGSEGSALFDAVMRLFVQRLCARQQRLHAAAAAKPIPEKYLDECSWSVTPSEVWALLGLWLVDLLAEALHSQERAAACGSTESAVEEKDNAAAAVAASHPCASCRALALEKARSTVVYWAAVQQVPLFSPSFIDGDIAAYLLPTPSAAPHPTAESPLPPLLVDLVRDIHSINKLAMQSKKTGMLICGGGVVKHHVCNANLMRNGADFTIILNNGQEFDGSDAGAKPEEALSWGKVRMEGAFVKVYGEITTYLPLLVAQVFVPAVRRRQGKAPASTPAKAKGGDAEAVARAPEKKRQDNRRLPRGGRAQGDTAASAEAAPVRAVEEAPAPEEAASQAVEHSE